MEKIYLYDVFLSYQWDHQEAMIAFRDYLMKNYKLRVFIDIAYTVSGDSLSQQLQESINASKLFVCFITKKYSESPNCVNEFTWAIKRRKMINIIVMMEKIELEDLKNGIGIEICTCLRSNLFRDMDPLKNINGEEFQKLVRDILLQLNLQFSTFHDTSNHQLLSPTDRLLNTNTNNRSFSKSPSLGGETTSAFSVNKPVGLTNNITSNNHLSNLLENTSDNRYFSKSPSSFDISHTTENTVNNNNLDLNKTTVRPLRLSPVPPSVKTVQQARTSYETTPNVKNSGDSNELNHFKPIVDIEINKIEDAKPITLKDSHRSRTQKMIYLNGYHRYQFDNGDIFNGMFIQGKREGHGKMTYNNGDVYDGEWQNDVKHGEGTYSYANGDIYSGNWENGQQNGFGVFETKNGDKYESNWKDGIMHGKCLINYADGTIFDGNFVNGMKDGFGKKKYSNGAFYSGEWKNGKQSGKGKLYFPNGDCYEGQIQDGTLNGFGIMTYKNGNKYEGYWINNNKHGKGKLIYFDNRSTYEGDFYEDNIRGNGTFSWSDGNRCEGFWINASQGTGTFYYNNNSKYNGELLNFQFHGNGTVTYSDGSQKTGAWRHGNFIQ